MAKRSWKKRGRNTKTHMTGALHPYVYRTATHQQRAVELDRAIARQAQANRRIRGR